MMAGNKEKDHTKSEIASIFDQLLANTIADNPEETLGSYHETNDAADTTENNDEPETNKLVVAGRRAIDNGDYAGSLKLFNQALELDPQCWDAWSAMGDALMEMGKIDQASICYKKAMASTFKLDDLFDGTDEPEPDNSENDWQNYLMSVLGQENIPPDSGEPRTEALPAKSRPPESPSGELDNALDDLFNKENPISRPHEESVQFPCPSCGHNVELESGICSGCQTTFSEEKFQNYEPLDDDLVFFGRIKALMGKEDRFFIHFNGEDGSIRFLDKKDISKSKKPSYVFVRANIEELGFNYPAGLMNVTGPNDIETDRDE